MSKQLQTFKRKYLDTLKCIDFFVEFMNEYKSEDHADQLEGQLGALEEAKRTFENVREKLLSEDDCDIESLCAEKGEYYKKYQKVKGFIVARQRSEEGISLPDANSTSVNQSLLCHRKLRLPTIDLPSFDGDITKWLTFKDRFMSMVHEVVELPEVTKLQYLLSALKGNVATQYEHTQLIADNYEPTWQSLLTRYDDAKTIKREYFKALYYLEAMNDSSGDELARVVNEVKRLVRGMERLKEPVDNWDTPLTSLIMYKMEATSLLAWEQASADTKSDTYKGLIEFCEKRIKVLANSTIHNVRTIDTRPARATNIARMPAICKEVKMNVKRTPTMAHVEQCDGRFKIGCPVCKDDHNLFKCAKFEAMNLEQRLSLVKELRLCYNCLKRGHGVRQCRSYYRCANCKKRHHTLVCSRPTEASEAVPPVVNATLHDRNSEKQKTIWLSTAQVLLLDSFGKDIPARALLDMGAQSNFMTERLAQQLGLKKQRMLRSLSGVGAMALTANSMVSATVKSRVSTYSALLDFIVLQRVTADVPAQTVSVDRWNIPSGVRLADPTFYKSERVDLLIGAELFADLLEKGHMKIAPQLPSLLETKFGWIVSGPMQESINNNSVLCHCIQEECLSDLMRHFAALEDIPEERVASEESVMCERLYCDTTIQNEEGRYVVQLPKIEDFEKQLGDSKATALRRFLSIERRLKGDESMRKEYVEFMKEYEELGHMSKVANAENIESETGKEYYLPHHAVWKGESTTTKCRVVFDASCKSSSGRSLNDILVTGPTIQEDMFSILLRFRTKRVALVADVAKMYRQVLVAEEDRKLQRILWRKGSEENISVYELNTVTYGTACAPFLAIRTLLRVFEDYGRHYPKATEMKEDFYVDDLVSGAESIEEAKQRASQMDELMSKGGFSLRKWASNYPETLEDIPQQRRNESSESDHANKLSISILGLLWNPTSDSFQLNIKLIEEQNSYSGKQILSCIARMYDPLGIIDPVKMKAKIFMQRVWSYKEMQGAGWDWNSPLPDELQVEWKMFFAELNLLNNISVPRTVIDRAEDKYQIHIFCDASEKGYGACCYIRNRNKHSGATMISLVTSKSKVAPLSRKLTIARLELCGALLASNLYQLVQRAIGKEAQCYMWTDSMTAWYWINSPSDRWKPFVANRTRRIQTKTKSCVWKHIPGVDNPADIVSRGSDPKALIDARQWWAGPSWLALDENMWPVSPNTKTITIDEERTTVLLVSSLDERSFSDRLFERCSTYTTLRKSVGYWLRYLNILRARKTAATHLKQTIRGLTTDELVESDKFLYRLAQRDQLAEELRDLVAKKCVSRSSPLRFLNPFVDEQGLMRVNGRLANSQLASAMKQPILIPKGHHLAKLLVQHYHLRLLHAGPQLMITTIRQSLWILGVRSLARSVYHKCMRCFKVNPKNIKQPMGNLPPSRVTEARPFAVSGVDYAGPVYVKAKHRRAAPTKAFVAVFVCFVTHAIHLELVSDLSTAAFISALRRFVARRGLISELYSDNGSNFKGAANELHQVCQLLQSTQHREAVTTWSADRGFKWKFIPPRAPHFGGLWESAVRSMKFHLQRVLGTASSTYEDLVTLLVEIESCLNSRPITPISNNACDFQALTPGHFLTGDHLQAIPNIDLKDIPENRLNHWRLIQKRLQHFWARWNTEYLQQLHARSKWNGSAIDIKPGMLVVLSEDNIPPLKWPLARVTDVHPGKDGVVRVVTVKTAQAKEVKRAVARICILPIEPSDKRDEENLLKSK